MSFFENTFFNKSKENDKSKRKLTPDEKLAEYFESSDRFEAEYYKNLKKINKEKLIENQKQKKDDNFTCAKERLLKIVESFIDGNPDFTNEQKEQKLSKFTKALELAMDIHSDQKPRPDGPYVNHILRVSTIIVEEYGIKDLDLVIAALLHDSVEDQSEKLANLTTNDENISDREKALLFINDNFGERVKNIVLKLTNIYHEDKNISQDQKNKVYLEHVKEAIEDPDVLPIKLADFSDNALNLESVKEIEKRLKLSHKYLPVIEVFIKQIEKSQNIFSSEKTIEIKKNLIFAIENTQNFINNQEKNSEYI
jgi:(p)ppGpp synthase/HD superfamily hydrolase